MAYPGGESRLTHSRRCRWWCSSSPSRFRGDRVPTTVDPVPSFMPQRPIRPLAEVNFGILGRLMSPCNRATFQTRASSRTPSKNPAAAPVKSWPSRARRAGCCRSGASDCRRGQASLQIAVEIEVPGCAVVGHGGVMPDVAGDGGDAQDRVILTERTRPAGPLLEIGRKLGGGWGGDVDPKEVIHVDGGAVSLRTTLCDQRNGALEAAAAGSGRVGGDACALLLKPRFDREF